MAKSHAMFQRFDHDLRDVCDAEAQGEGLREPVYRSAQRVQRLDEIRIVEQGNAVGGHRLNGSRRSCTETEQQ